MKQYKKITFLLILISFIVRAQELPPLVNYSPKDYSGENQNWDIDQSSDNYIYIANNRGLLEFNGANWNIYPVPNNSVIRSVKVVEDKVFIGCYMDFGFWKRDEYGNLNFTSIISKLNIPLLEDETFWNILHFETYVLFQSLDRIYIYNLQDESYTIIDALTKRAFIFNIGNYIYFQKSDQGLFKIENGKSVLISNQNVVKTQELVGGFLVDKTPLFLTDKGEFYFLKGNKFSRWNISSDLILKSKKIYSSAQLSDGSLILGTISNGVYHISAEGDFIRSINKENGLLNNTVLIVFEDNDKNIWLGLDNGISVINLNSTFISIYNDTKGDIGSVYTSIIFKENLYVGTNQGLFYKSINSNGELKLVNGTKGQVWSLSKIDETLFCGHNGGTFVIENNKATKVSDFSGTWGIKKIASQNNLLLQGNYNGISILEKSNNKWKFRNKIEGFDISSRFFEFIDTNELMINHEYKGIFKLKLNNTYTKVISQKKYKNLGEESSLVLYNNKLLHASSSGVYQYNNSKSGFEKDTVLSSLLYDKSDPIVGNLIKDKTNKLWGISNRNIVCITYDAFSNKPKRINIPVQKSYRSSKVISGFENLNHLVGEIFLIGNTTGFSTLNLDKLKTKSYSVNINSIYKQTLNHEKQQLAINQNHNLKANSNNLYISYSVAEFDKNIEVNYQYRLKGIYNDWSEWSEKSNIVFNNLPFGDYTFEVKARVGNEISNNIASFNFNIDRPWYMSNLAIVIYAILAFLLFLLIHTLYKRHYTRQKQKLVETKQREFALSQLESDKVIMKLKNEKLKNEVESKTRELSSSAMNIIKKNELLNTIKKELLAIKNDAGIAPVIKTINKNLSTNSDWEMFQEAFNNADTDFLKKVKDLHPNLTPNDLRLCAYLRLNLSSKEIAPLLNISARSVEIKRYRLRKKMDLQHEKSLVEYVLDI
ncbi:triple tyrosine motif-containing protein [Lutibacter sp. TH_r2]|uniref:triple tyrosine motif-containing protein n=1 Tax=Lutibacter sp. TH_r2 TaxID=3082083 RepID=UPI00295519E8|nr:triple tyrosine motif-containing protein [Lutibacter sp. TH_r2]MDV7186056.1 triple tyrosine motif-containing protein [Lutibacter sp. TH_r2]